MKPRLRKALRIMLIAAVALLVSGAIFVRFGNSIARAFENSAPSRSLGSRDHGSLVNGKRLPTRKRNYRAYSYLGAALGRNSVHHRVRRVILDAYARLEDTVPDSTFVYGECSWPSGGRLKPHKTHRNGLSVDFMVPVKASKTPVVLKTHIFNKYGYKIHFDRDGWCEAQKCRIDFAALAAHLHCLAEAADAEGLTISRVIFDSDLQRHLLATAKGNSLRKRLNFVGESWIRHDEHYHVDFENPDAQDSQQDGAHQPATRQESESE